MRAALAIAVGAGIARQRPVWFAAPDTADSIASESAIVRSVAPVDVPASRRSRHEPLSPSVVFIEPALQEDVAESWFSTNWARQDGIRDEERARDAVLPRDGMNDSISHAAISAIFFMFILALLRVSRLRGGAQPLLMLICVCGVTSIFPLYDDTHWQAVVPAALLVAALESGCCLFAWLQASSDAVRAEFLRLAMRECACSSIALLIWSLQFSASGCLWPFQYCALECSALLWGHHFLPGLLEWRQRPAKALSISLLVMTLPQLAPAGAFACIALASFQLPYILGEWEHQLGFDKLSVETSASAAAAGLQPAVDTKGADAMPRSYSKQPLLAKSAAVVRAELGVLPKSASVGTRAGSSSSAPSTARIASARVSTALCASKVLQEKTDRRLKAQPHMELPSPRVEHPRVHLRPATEMANWLWEKWCKFRTLIAALRPQLLVWDARVRKAAMDILLEVLSLGWSCTKLFCSTVAWLTCRCYVMIQQHASKPTAVAQEKATTTPCKEVRFDIASASPLPRPTLLSNAGAPWTSIANNIATSPSTPTVALAAHNSPVPELLMTPEATLAAPVAPRKGSTVEASSCCAQASNKPRKMSLDALRARRFSRGPSGQHAGSEMWSEQKMVTLGKISHTVSTPRHNVVEANDAAAQEDMANSAVFAELARRRAVQSSSAAPPIVPVLSEPARRRAEFRQRSASRLRSNDVADVAVAPSRQGLVMQTASSGACASQEPRNRQPHRQRSPATRKENVWHSTASENLQPSEKHGISSLVLQQKQGKEKQRPQVPQLAQQQQQHVPQAFSSLQVEMRSRRSGSVERRPRAAAANSSMRVTGGNCDIFVDPEFALQDATTCAGNATEHAAAVGSFMRFCDLVEDGHDSAMRNLQQQLETAIARRRHR